MGENGPTGHAYTAAAVAERDRRKGIKDAERAKTDQEARKEKVRRPTTPRLPAAPAAAPSVAKLPARSPW